MGAGSSKTKDTQKELLENGKDGSNKEKEIVNDDSATFVDKQDVKTDKSEDTIDDNIVEIVQLVKEHEKKDVLITKKPKKEVIKTKTKNRVQDGGKAAWNTSKSRKKSNSKSLSNEGQTTERVQPECVEYELEGADHNSTTLKQENETVQLQVTEKKHKEDGEKFDPTKIIDVDKFRAANAPENKTKVQEKVSELTTYQDYKTQFREYQKEKDLNQNHNIPTKDNRKPRISKEGLVIYDEEEEELMVSIEKEFFPDDALPGAVTSS